MDWNIKVLKNSEYAGALKTALELRKAGKLPAAAEEQLGIMVQNIARWAIGTGVSKGKLWRTVADDEDFRAHVVMRVCMKLDRVDVTREPKEIISYLYRVAVTDGISGWLDMAGAKKRQADIVSMYDEAVQVDFNGSPCRGPARKTMNINND